MSMSNDGAGKYLRRATQATHGVQKCACGQAMTATHYNNSGTTYISEACPVLVEFWGPDRYVWRYAKPPHQFVCRTTAEHAATGCCDHRDVQTHP